MEVGVVDMGEGVVGVCSAWEGVVGCCREDLGEGLGREQETFGGSWGGGDMVGYGWGMRNCLYILRFGRAVYLQYIYGSKVDVTQQHGSSSDGQALLPYSMRSRASSLIVSYIP